MGGGCVDDDDGDMLVVTVEWWSSMGMGSGWVVRCRLSEGGGVNGALVAICRWVAFVGGDAAETAGGGERRVEASE
ncbi:hypothetical protein Tco_1045141 [Tanacetum coccineum]|uniref:Uncharacterized protein n=1 Tax=Tanacetum coccineum TaxID=301880 RepID=A0ABQ5GT59_9ASTR